MTPQTLLFLIAVVVVIGALAYFSRKEGRPGSFQARAEDRKDQWGTPTGADERQTPESAQRLVVADIQMHFESMMIFMIKWALVSIPAAIVLSLVFIFLITLLGQVVTA